MKFKRFDRKEMNRVLYAEAKSILSQKGARISLVAAFVFITASAGAGLVASYLLLNFLEYFALPISDIAAYAIMVCIIYLFSAPALAGMRSVCAVLCGGREADISELFVAFSSFERFFAAYFGALLIFLKYVIAILLLLVPDLVEYFFFRGAEDVPLYIYAIALASLITAIAWLILTSRLSRLFHYLWSRRMPVFKAIGAAYLGKYIPRGISSSDLLNIFLSVITCFTYFIFHAGPVLVIESELSALRQDKYINQLNTEKSRKDGQKK